MFNDIVIVFFAGLAIVLAILALFQLGVARLRFRQRKFGTIIVMYGNILLALLVFKLTVLLTFDGPLMALGGLDGSYNFGWIPYYFRYWIVVALAFVAILVLCAGAGYAVIWSSSEDFWPKVWSVLLFIFYAWLIGAIAVGMR